MTREEVIAAILDLNARLGRVPSRLELAKEAKISRLDIRRYFGNYERALRAGNLEKPLGRKVELAVLFEDWAAVARKLGKLPTVYDYEEMGKYSQRPLTTRFGTWAKVPSGMKVYAEEKGLAPEWKDVMEMIAERETRLGANSKMAATTLYDADIMADRPMYGRLMRPCPLLCEPTNEQGVFFLFACMAYDMGFLVLRLQAGFPDCEAFRKVGQDRLQRVKVELEYESRNFLRHGHNVNDADIIVCWEHNWPECPVEVIELKKLVANWQWMIGQNR
jgi:hypothetical protein